MKPPRLAWPLTISLILHAGIGWLCFPGSAEHPPRRAKSANLTVVLPDRERTASPPLAAKEPTSAPGSVSAAAPEVPGKLTQKARFLVAPDLATLEDIPVPASGSITLLLTVSPLGTVERVAVAKGDPIPKELLDGLLGLFARARLAPALAGTRPVASTLELMIRFEAGPDPLANKP